MGVASVGANAYRGYCDARRIPFRKEYVEMMITYLPTIVQAGLGAIGCGISSAIGGRIIVIPTFGWRAKSAATEIEDKTIRTARTVAGVGVGGVLGGAMGAIQTIAGYGLGYIIGDIMEGKFKINWV